MSCRELTIEGVQTSFSVSKSSAYRLAKSNGWQCLSKPLPRGGHRKYYLVPEEQIPEVDSKAKVKSLPETVKAEVVEYDNTGFASRHSNTGA